LFERSALEGNGLLERPHTQSGDLEDHLSKLTEENKKLVEELSSLKMKLTESQVSNTDFLIHSGYFYSACSSPLLLLRGAPDYSIDTVLELTHRSATGSYA